jgi:predicted ATP-dependent serine protease
MYKCPECGYISAWPGECPTCNIPLLEEVDEIEGEEDLEKWEEYFEEKE